MRCMVLCAAVFAVVSSGCEGGVAHPEAFAELERAGAAAAEGAVVAKVGDRALTGRELVELWRMRPELSRAEALEALIEQELLAQEGLARRLRSATLEDARKRGLGRALLDADVVGKAGEVGDPIVDYVLNKERQAQLQPNGLLASHLLIRGPALRDEQGWQAAERALEAARAQLPARAGSLELMAAARELDASGTLGDGLATHVDAQMKFPRRGEAQSLPSGWIRLVPAFVEAAEKAADDGRLGEAIGPVRTSFGAHLIVVHERLDAPVIDEDRLVKSARAKAQSIHEQSVFDAFIATLRDAHVWSVFPEALLEDAAGGT